MPFSLFANKNIHTEEIRIFREVNPTGVVHTLLTTFPTYVRSTPTIYVFETKDLIVGSDNVMAFLKERAPKKEKAVRTPRVLVKDRVQTPEPEDSSTNTDLAPRASVLAPVKKEPVPPISVETTEKKTVEGPVVPTYTVENTVPKVDADEKPKPEAAVEPLKKTRKRTSRAKKVTEDASS